MSLDSSQDANPTQESRSFWAFIPIVVMLQGYSLRAFWDDFKSGINVSLLDFPQGMAYALIAGLPVQYGIYASAIASIIGPIFASSRYLMLGPTNATAVLLMSAFLGLEMDRAASLSVLPLLLCLVGVFMILAAVFKLAGVIRYVSKSVITGYVTAAAFLIVINQVSVLMGFSRPQGATFFEVLELTLAHFTAPSFATLLLGVITFGFFYILKRFFKHLPYVAITLIAAASLGYFITHLGFSLDSVHAVPSGSWSLTFPQWDFELARDLGSPALALACLAIIESSSVAKNLAAHGGDRVDINQQIFSLGLANVGSALGSGMAVSGSLARSQLNFESGARTPVASMVSGSILIFGVLLLGPYFSMIPRVALAVIVIMVGFSLIQKDLIKTIIKSTRADAVVFGMTFVGGLIFHLESAVFIGVAVSIVYFLKQVGRPELVEFEFNEEGELSEKLKKQDSQEPEISIVHVEGDIFFGSTDIFLDQARFMVQDANLKVIILRMRNARNIDATSAMAIIDLVRFARERGRDLIISGALPQVESVFRNSGLMERVGEHNFFPYMPENPNMSTRKALKRAQIIIGQKTANIKLFVTPKEDDAGPGL